MIDDVSRETPPVPDVARGVFGDRLPLITAYADLLAREGTVRGLIGPREVPRLWERHLLNCAVAAELVPSGARVADVGSGAGLPGLVWAILRPDLEVTLVEPLLRRTTFLDEVVDQLALQSVTVRRDRAEDVDEIFDVVTSRAVAPLGRLAGWSLPLVTRGGVMLALKGAGAAAELEEHRSTVGRHGGLRPEVVEVGRGVVDPPVRVVRIHTR